ncbi:ribosome biogenesis GTPase Der [Psittacicella hinzii]|uniref:GTPase Der n=1 Tax=Psittacicella hinzii TaxID=2028575 RepID=A0A3A1YD67_9GAMM|nr:ribosome biogenesis GTPase Der [Psittacicella hinzii]RIY35110.1 ribosome biogenesis GTPase Der [Psittacicella hinzii]
MSITNQKTVIALVGRPNVGKSTLFNRLTKTRDALVADFPGLTRDRKYGIARYNEQEYILIDTGGLEGNEEGIETKMAEQSLLAIQESDIVFMLVDARAGLMPGDESIVNLLRKREKPVILVANKIDGLNKDVALADFYSLGFDNVIGISSSNNIGISGLLDTAFSFIDQQYEQQDVLDDQVADEQEEIDLIEQEDNLIDEEYEYLDDEELEGKIKDISEAQIQADNESAIAQTLQTNIKIAIVGRPNVGKSTLTNCMIGEDRVIVYDMPGTTRDSIYIPLEHQGQSYTVIDTAGVRKKGKIYEAVEKFSVIKTLQAIEDANVCLLVIDATQGLTDQDLSLLSFILNAGRSIVILLNKWDAVTEDERKFIREELDRKLGFINFARIHFISALRRQGIGDIFKYVQEAFISANRRVNTSMLTKILQMAVHNYQPPQVNGRRVKLKYAHAGGHNPPIIVVHGNLCNELPDSYKKYLMNYYRKTLNIIGAPINFKFENSRNPYEGKRNKLTRSQIRKKKRLQKFIKRQSA